MASTEFLEHALSTKVDENSVNAIVGSLENVIGSQNCNTTSNANPIIGGHKYIADNISSGGIVNSIHANLLSNSSASFNNVQVSTASVYSPMSIAGVVPNTNEALKVIYSQAQALANHNNSVALSAHNQALVNACVGQASQNHILQGSPVSSVLPQGNKNSGMHTPLMLKQSTNNGQVGMQPGMVTVPMTVNSSMPSSIPNVMTLNKPVGQNVVSTQNLGSPQPTIIPNVQILNMRHGAPTVAAQKSVATVSPRVVIGAPQVVGARATAPHPGVATVSTSMAAAPMQTQMSSPPMGSSVPSSPINMTPAMIPQQPASATTHIKPSDNTKEKCRNFLANLLDLSSKEPPSVERNVRNLIQELIDAQVEPEEFCDRLEKLLNASPQPCLIGFLKKSLPLLRQSLVTKELTIEGINPPSPHVVFPMPPPPPAHSMMAPPNVPMQKPEHRNQKPGSTISVLQNIPIHTKINVNKVNTGKVMTGNSKSSFPRTTGSSAALSTILTPKSYMKDKEKKSLGQFSSQPFVDDKMPADDDINDVAAMGGVNLAEESQRILGSTEMIGTQIRSCKEEYLVPMAVMQARVKNVSLKHGLEEPSAEVAGLLSHAVQERIKNMVEKLAVTAQHRIDLVKTDSRYEVTEDVKNQLKFLEELDRVDKKRREDSEREILLRAAKSRSKNEDPEQAKLKAKAKEMQRAELEELRQREANLTALQAIGPRKKPRLEGPGGSGDSVTNGNGLASAGIAGRSQMALRTRLKRINHRDMVFLMEQESDTAHSKLLYRSYLK